MKKILVLAILAVAVLAVMPAFALCNPAEGFGQLGSDGTLIYTNFPANYVPASIIGRLWQPGARALNNEGTWVATDPANGWLIPFGNTGGVDNYVINGYLGTVGDVGCIHTAMISLLEAQTADGGSCFMVDRVVENPGAAFYFDFTLVTRPGTQFAAPIPNPSVALVSNNAGVLTMNVSAPAGIAAGYYGDASNTDASLTLTNLRLMQLVGSGTAVPSTAAAGWTVVGGATPVSAVNGGVAAAGLTFDCNALTTGQDLFLAWQINYDNGQFFGDFVGKPTQVRCKSTLANPKGKPIGRGHEKH